MATRNQVDVGLAGSSGSGAFAGTTSPTFVSPILGAATGTSLITSGSVTAGLGAGGSPGTLISFPTTTGKGRLVVAAADNATGAFDTTISNGTAIGQAQVISIPDSGAATAKFILSTGATQTIGNGLTLTTPILGAATATSINKVTITQPAGSATLTIADGKILTVNNTLTFTGTDTSSVAFGTGGTVAYVGGSGTIVTASISGTTQAAVVNTRYIVANAGQTTITLPTTFAIGDSVIIKGLGAGGWILAAGTATTIRIGSSVTSSAGNLTSANQYDTVFVSGLVANTTWSVDYVLSTGLTIA